MQPEDLTPIVLTCFDKLKESLPVEISSRLKCSRHVRRHGNVRTLYLFNIWDKNQKDLFHNKYFSYCLGYDPMFVKSPTKWYLHLWVNTVRIYQYSDVIRRALINIVEHQCPPSFKPLVNEKSVQAVHRAKFMGTLDDFEGYFLPLYQELIGSIHPYLEPIIDSFVYSLTKEERIEVIQSREKQYFGPRKRMSPEEIRLYSRSIPPSWKPEILETHNWECAHCKTSLRDTEYHIDHFKPFSKGGPTTKKNLQPLCAKCNLEKGNRFTG